MLFHDCLGREIQEGDVLASGYRKDAHGGIRIGIVRGFSVKSILVDVLDDGYPPEQVGRNHTMPYDQWTLRRMHFNAPYNCFITGMTEAELYQATNQRVGALT